MAKKSWMMVKPTKAIIAEIEDAINRVLDATDIPLPEDHKWSDLTADVIDVLKHNYTRWGAYRTTMHNKANVMYNFIYHKVRNSFKSKIAAHEKHS